MNEYLGKFQEEILQMIAMEWSGVRSKAFSPRGFNKCYRHVISVSLG